MKKNKIFFRKFKLPDVAWVVCHYGREHDVYFQLELVADVEYFFVAVEGFCEFVVIVEDYFFEVVAFAVEYELGACLLNEPELEFSFGLVAEDAGYQAFVLMVSVVDDSDAHGSAVADDVPADAADLELDASLEHFVDWEEALQVFH